MIIDRKPKIFPRNFSFRDDSSINESNHHQMSRKRKSVVSTTSRFGLGKKKINQYVIDKTLGKGSFATVYLCTDKNTKIKYALKAMNK
jgi:serine/threonine protein kinase